LKTVKTLARTMLAYERLAVCGGDTVVAWRRSASRVVSPRGGSCGRLDAAAVMDYS
jgi:hypothetical protein